MHLFAANTIQLDTSNLPRTNVSPSRVVEFANVAIGIFAAVAVLVIVIAGLRYVVARGDPNALAQAKNMIIYALAGLAICILAFTIVNFVLSHI